MIDYFEIIGALTTEYLDVYMIEPERDEGVTLKLNGNMIAASMDNPEYFCYSERFRTYLSDEVYPEDREHLLELASPEALIDHFTRSSDRLELNYRVLQEDSLHHYRGLYTRISQPGAPLKLISSFRNIDYKISMQEEIRHEGLNHAYTAISNIYLCMYRLNLDSNTFFTIKTTDAISKYLLPDSDLFDENVKNIVQGLVTDECYSSALEFLDISDLESRMRRKAHLSLKLDGRDSQMYRLHFIKEDTDENGHDGHIIFAIEVLDEDEYRSVFDALARNFQNVFWVNLTNGTARILKLDGYITKGLDKNDHCFFSYPAILKQYISERVFPEDKQSLYDKLCVKNLCHVLTRQREYVGNYRVLVDGEIHNYQFNYIKMSGFEFVVCGFQNIDTIIEEHLAEEKIQREKEEAYQKELIAAKDEANRANAAKTNFLLRMSHDIRTPINGIMGMLDIAEQFSDDLARQADCREKVKASSKILLELINEVLDMGKLESGEIILEHIPFCLAEISRDVYNAVKKLADEKNITIVEEDCHTTQKNLVGSPLHLKRLMMNIVSNAIKYNRDNGKIYITCKVLDEDETSATVEFKCRDTGIGMSPEFLEHIFEPFSQENTSVRSQYAGTGLGMSITKSLAEKMGGSITVESTKGEGSTFDVLIPFETDASASVSTSAETDTSHYSIQDIHILLVEDNELNMEIATFLLERNGADVTPSWNGQEAVDTFAKSFPGTFDIILMDVIMPVMNGYDATKRIRNMDRSDARSIPIVAMTANTFTEDKLAAKAAGMNGHIAKPLDLKHVVRTIAELTAKRPISASENPIYAKGRP